MYQLLTSNYFCLNFKGFIFFYGQKSRVHKHYFLQNCLENKIKREKISNRPASMEKIKSHLLGKFKPAKELLTVPIPAPAFANVAVIAEKAVIKSFPKAMNTIINNKNSAIKTDRNPHMDCNMGSGKTCFPNLIGMMALGCNRRTISRLLCLNSNRARKTFIPPLVDAAHPPMIANNMIKIGT